MEILTGTATNIRFSTDVCGGEYSTSTSHIAVIELNGKTTQLIMANSIFIDKGDYIVVAGEYSNGVFEAVAYKNISKNIVGYEDNSINLHLIAGILLILAGIGNLTGVFGVILLAAGVYLTYNSKRVSEANKLINEYS